MISQLGIAVRIYEGDGPTQSRDSGYTLALASAEGCPRNGYFHLPDLSGEFTFRFHPWKAWDSTLLDASSTYGLMGGIDDKSQALVSEAVERNISDMITRCVAIWCDGSENYDANIWILGPALPKLIGRLASLRLPRQTRILWVTPRPLPDWYSAYSASFRMPHSRVVASDVLIPPMALTEESLVRDEFVHHSGGVVQRLCIHGESPIENLDQHFQSAWAGQSCAVPDPLRLAMLVLALGSEDKPLGAFAESHAEGFRELRETTPISIDESADSDREILAAHAADPLGILPAYLDKVCADL